MWHVGVVSIMPQMFAALNEGITGRAIASGLARVDHWNPRDWARTPHRAVDDKPYGGGPGMVMMYEPLHAAIECALEQLPSSCKTIYLSPQGRQIQQADLNLLAKQQQSLLFIAGRYEGIDERIITQDVDEEWSLGDFVLSGGELAAMVFIDAVIRLLPGSLGDPGSATQDSFMTGLLDHPHYTRPETVGEATVPPVLLGGSHREIDRWRRKHALGQTWLKRPDLLSKLLLNETDKQLLVEFKHEHGEPITGSADLRSET
jgi:tRNA (guanine37-N1)-methyltransferase